MTWRCGDCNHNWPHYRQYEKCLQCGEQCKSMNHEPMADKSATELATRLREDRKAEEERLQSHKDFEKWYEDREVARFRAELDAAKLC